MPCKYLNNIPALQSLKAEYETNDLQDEYFCRVYFYDCTDYFPFCGFITVFMTFSMSASPRLLFCFSFL